MSLRRTFGDAQSEFQGRRRVRPHLIGHDVDVLRRRKTERTTAAEAGLVLSLPLPPTPEHMADHAANLVPIVRNVEKVELDYSLDSLREVDSSLGRFHEEGVDPNRIAETLFLFGAYVGEVIVRQKNASWTTVSEDHPMGAANGWPLVKLANGNFLNPIGKVFKRVQNGAEDSIPYFVQALADG
jgi:hypothetical protein